MRSIVNNSNNRLLNNIIHDEYQKVKSNPYMIFQAGPEKKYEIYCINNDESRLILGYIDDYNIDTTQSDESEVFYNRNNAIEVYNLLDIVNNNSINSFPELIDNYQPEIEQLLYKIELIKTEDEKEYQKDKDLYNNLIKSYYYYNTSNEYDNLRKSNFNLIKKYNSLLENRDKTLKQLSYTLNKYQEINTKEDNEKKENKNFFKRIIYKLLQK